jgi:uncharacterized protein
MEAYFLDTSALIKRYIEESGHHWVTMICQPDRSNTLYISQATMVEAIATICRKAREQNITVAHRNELITKFRKDYRSHYRVTRVTNAIYTKAGNLCTRHKLRAYDAVQLACALAVRDRALTRSQVVPIFVCADSDLLAIAATEGLAAENPNEHG